MSEIMTKNETKRHGSLAKEEINTLFKNAEKKTSKEEESTDSISLIALDDLALGDFSDSEDFPMDITVSDSVFENIEEFAAYLPKRQQKDKLYGSNYQKGDMLFGAWQ
jgi:hypothetical protein